MRLFNRLRHVVTADAHGMIDALEDKALLLRQGVREAEIALADKRARLDGMRAEVKQLIETQDRLDARIKGLDADVALALSAGEDDLARFTVRRLLPMQRERTQRAERLTVVKADAAALAEEVERQAEDLDALKLRVRERLAALEREGADPFAPAPVADEEIELELLRRRRAGEAG
ncbi:MAG: PspA/IM30 family protein [Myxococcales bacterium]|nr:PspA/IM30 family protein [Myxococcales bacterium]